MSDFFDRLANSAKQAQSDRIIRQSQKKLLSPFATYQGKDPVDGTDRVAIDGVTNSGFKLISNAPVSVGERVYLRKNTQGGLQRVDAMNRPIIVPVPTPEPPPVVVDNAFVFSCALIADLRVELTTYDEFGDIDQSGSYQRRLAIANGLLGLNSVRNLVYSDPERILVDKLLTGINITSSAGGQALQVNSGTSGADPIWATYDLNAFSVFGAQLRNSEFSFGATPIAKLTQIYFGITSVIDDSFFLTPLPPYAYDITFSASNFYLVPIVDASSIPLSDGSPILRTGSGVLWDGEVYAGDTLLRSWSNLDFIYPDIEIDINASGIPIDDMGDDEYRDVDYWWRYKRSGAANWYDL